MLIRRDRRALEANAMATLDVNELVDRIDRVITQAVDAGREEDWSSVYLFLKEALDTAKQLTEKQPLPRV
jgi:hypothetical protein